MQFIKNGPDIPEQLLQAHEDGNVVFFSGAGISYPAKLPGFKGLVDSIIEGLGLSLDSVQETAYKAWQFDTVITLLEASIVGGRELIRLALASALKPDLTTKKSTATHEALLELGMNRSGKLRLVTTNFDRLFEEVKKRKKQSFDCFEAPFLPVPKNQWDGLVYIHGLLDEAPGLKSLNRLVVSSGDFGRAYLTERWASRFVSELFRNYTVCFVGYSINDPILRYMMDALAADRQLGEATPEMFAFGSYSKNKKEGQENEWKAKNVTPILYPETRTHSYLHKTLHLWAETYRDGIRGKERIVIESALATPHKSTKQDDFVGRMLWALSASDGLPAKRFADLDPVPSISWLVPLSENRFGEKDLHRFGIIPTTKCDDDLTYSMLNRPCSFQNAPMMKLADTGFGQTKWDPIMQHLARWLTRHLNDPDLILWVAQQGGQLHEDFKWLIGKRLNELHKLEKEDKKEELDHILASSPNAIPNSELRTLWLLLLTNRVKTRKHDFELHRWLERFHDEGLTATLRLRLRDLLSPKVTLRGPYRLDEFEKGIQEETKKDVECEVVLSVDDVHSLSKDFADTPQWHMALSELLPDFSALLKDVMDLMRELGDAGDKDDISYIHQPSISKHEQNNDFHDWTVLITLTRDAWVALAEQSPDMANQVAESWMSISYPVFKRLAYFAATQDNIIEPEIALDWLLKDEGWWLWSVGTEREAIRLMVAIASKLDEECRKNLEKAIISGPPRQMFSEYIDDENWGQIMEREIWLRLAKILESGVIFNKEAKTRFDDLSSKNPKWKLEEDERDEFPFWMGDGKEVRKFIKTPQRREELAKYLIEHPTLSYMQEDDWSQRCRNDFSTTACALLQLAGEGVWLSDRWNHALQAWSEGRNTKRSWRYMGPVLSKTSNANIQSVAVVSG